MTAADVLRALPTRLAWLILAGGIAAGAAGLHAALDHAPGTAARAELTWAGDRAADAALDAALERLRALRDEVDLLSMTARGSLAALAAGDAAALATLIAEGTLRVTAIGERAAELRAAVDAVPTGGDLAPAIVSAAIVERHAEMDRAARTTGALAAEWSAFALRATDGVALVGLLERHDREVADAARTGAAGDYRTALARIAIADATLAEARTLGAALGAVRPGSTLDDWLVRHEAYDAALRNLYEVLVRAGGRVTATVRERFAAEASARAALPADPGGLVVIVGEVAQGGLNEAVAAIEGVRGALGSAIEAQARLDAPAIVTP